MPRAGIGWVGYGISGDDGDQWDDFGGADWR